jgi:hypothetical protein
MPCKIGLNVKGQLEWTKRAIVGEQVRQERPRLPTGLEFVIDTPVLNQLILDAFTGKMSWLAASEQHSLTACQSIKQLIARTGK